MSMDLFNAAAHPRHPRGQFKGKRQSSPGIELVEPDEFLPRGLPENQLAMPIALSGDRGESLAEHRVPDAGGYAGWGAGLWDDSSCRSLAARERHERATLYLELGAPGVNPFDIFDRLTALGESP